MDRSNSVAALAQIVPPMHDRYEQIDWSEVEVAGHTRFPSDYVQFMQMFGAGTISDTIVVLRPTSGGGGPSSREPSMEVETENARCTWEMDGDEADFDMDPASIVAWGATSGADMYCWVTTDDDPDRWPVLVCGRHTSPLFQMHPFGMVEFLHKLLSDLTFQERTVSVVMPEAVTFVN
ncbi:SMI1/KNR4 family protein [Streptomyces sp. NPDC051956]|uniref:SMI1/KNR4 family protein n=1 Tax=Streptomyces sp. NPDC051956 TaxID=3365677 RepID=UPI0037D624F0